MRRLLLLSLLFACAPKNLTTDASDELPSFADLQAAGLKAIEQAPPEQQGQVLIENATVWTGTGTAPALGWVHFGNGRILALGQGKAPETPGATLVNGEGAWVTPGLIDTHSHLGVYPSPGARAHGDGNEATAPTTPGVWAEHSFWPQDPGLERAAAGGITALQVLPGSANLIGGRGVVLQLLPTRGSRAMRFPGAPETVKMACGENPKRVYGEKGGPSTRMGNLRNHRSVFLNAQEKGKAWEHYEKEREAGKDPEMPERDLNTETLIGILDGRFLTQVHCYRADDMLSLLQLADEFGFAIRSFHHGLEAYKIRDILAKQNVAVSTWADWWGFKMEAYDGIPTNAALLTEAGAKAIIHSDSGEGIQRLNQEAAKAYHWGKQAGLSISEEDALAWITLNPAWALGIEDQTGSLEVGKRADIALWDRHPFSVYARPTRVWSNGTLSFDADSESAPWSDFLTGQEIQP